MSNTKDDQNSTKSQVIERCVYADMGDDSIPDYVDMNDYSGKDAKSHIHLLAVIEMQKRIYCVNY